MERFDQRKVTQLAVFLVTVIVVVAAATLGSIVGGTGAGAGTYEEFDAATLVPDRPAATGRVAAPSADREGLVLIDRSHGNRFDPETIQPFTSAITSAGYTVDFIEGSEDFEAELGRADALVVIDPNDPYTPAEADRVQAFVDRGGRLLLLGEPASMALEAGFLGQTLVDQPPALTTLSSRFGIEFGAGYLYNMDSNDGNFQNVLARPAGDSALAADVNRTAMYIPTSVESSTAEPVLVAESGTHSARGDVPGEYPVAVVDGDVLAVGDKTFLARGNFNVADNERFLENVVAFLVTGSPTQSVLEYPGVVSRDPTIRYTAVDLIDAAQVLGADLRGPRGEVTLRLSRGSIDPNGTDVLVTTFDDLAAAGAPVGITAVGGRVRVDGYESQSRGVAVIRAPDSGIDLVIAADHHGRAESAAESLVAGEAAANAISAETIVQRTPGAPADDGEDEESATTPTV